MLDERRVLQGFADALEPASKLLLSATGTRVLFLIAARPGVSDKDIRLALGVTSGSLTHVMARLGSRGRHVPGTGKTVEGLDLIIGTPIDGRQNSYVLTQKGFDLVSESVWRLTGHRLAEVSLPTPEEVLKTKMAEYEREMRRKLGLPSEEPSAEAIDELS